MTFKCCKKETFKNNRNHFDPGYTTDRAECVCLNVTAAADDSPGWR